MAVASTIAEAYQARIAADRLSPDPAQAQAVQKFSALEQQLRDYVSVAKLPSLWNRLSGNRAKPLPQGLYIHGDVGRGKSLLMDVFFEGIQSLYPSQRVHFHAFMHEVHHLLETHRQAQQTDPIPTVADAIIERGWLICFDEFFVQDIADAMILGRLFQLLFARGVVVVATSNIAINDLYLHGLQRAQFLPFISIFQQHMEEFLLDAKQDYRQYSLSHLPRYFLPDQAETYLNAHRALIAHLPHTTLHLQVYNRALHFPDFHRNILRTDFATLCDHPLGSADYLQIAEHAKVLFLDSVPSLSGADNDSRARRFLHLIDCLYDAHCQLFMQMQQPLEMLYSTGRLDFEFARCQSRLQEMQTREYIQSIFLDNNR